METFKIAEKIYEDLNKKGAGLGNVSIVIIQKSIDEMVVNKTVLLPDVMPSGFTLQQENAIWGVIQFLAKEQHKDPRKVRKRADVFKMIKDELDW